MRNADRSENLEGRSSKLSGIWHSALALSLVSAQVVPLPLPGLSAVSLAPVAAQRTHTIQCYSRGNQSNTCRLPEGTQSVSFVGPDRSARCQQGRTWAQRGDSLWVSGGCGGSFEAVVYGGGNGGGWGGGSGGSGGSWGGGNSGNEITCRSQNNRTQRCSIYTGNRVQMIQQYSNSPCIQGRSWSYDRNSITVRDGCQARFAVNGYSGGGSGGGWGGSGGNQGFQNVIECRSQNNRYARCRADTQNRVQLIRQISNTRCSQNRNWGYDRGGIWVDNGCSAQFGYGYGNAGGNWNGGSGSSGGTDAGDIIGGVALAAGLIALLAAAGRSGSSKSSNTTAIAAIDADVQKFPSAARTDANACLKEASRQVGATGGTRIRLTDVDAAQRSGDGWMILARLSATYDDHIQAMTMDCRSTNGKVTAFDVR